MTNPNFLLLGWEHAECNSHGVSCNKDRFLYGPSSGDFLSPRIPELS